ncbi:MAG: zf-HC2 domain-containing protein [Acidobacteria bacterium]|nr:zf-HC2 domain-containing protein [Acidobacteriota bacterium]MBS1865609.1 zf-HC2 domain-containing protein [Acidobacteriota bacterium]
MEHLMEEQLIAFHDGERSDRERVSAHLASCAECRAALEKIEAVFAAMDSLPIPDPGENYGQRVWAQISSRLHERQPSSWKSWWESFFAPRRLVAVGAFAAIAVAAFLAGRFWGHPSSGQPPLDAAQVRERILVVAVGDHLSKSEMFLVELSNAQPNSASGKLVNIAAQQKRAGDLLDENRLYRQTALQEGDKVMASTLDDLERVLIDIANSPQEVTPARFDSMQKRLASRGILFKVRVIRQGLQDRSKPAKQPAQKPMQQNISKGSSQEGHRA